MRVVVTACILLLVLEVALALSVVTNGACPNNCNGNGDCVNGLCSCKSGFTGLECSLNYGGMYACHKSCAEHGNCDNMGKCHCANGYTGADCSVYAPMPCPLNCSSQGECDVTTRTCKCINGFTGPDCATANIPLFPAVSAQVIRCNNDCTNRGICSHGVCFCHDGFGGDDCGLSLAQMQRMFASTTSIQLKAELSAPRSAPLPASREELEVIESYSKTNSKLSKAQVADSQRAVPIQSYSSGNDGFDCPQNCSDHGKCVKGPQGGGVCTCDTGYEGIDCGYEVACPGNCMGHGTCKAGTCSCDFGYTGKDCSQLPTCRHRCFGHGYCVYGHCVCDPGYSGPDCREAMFCMGDCSGHGSCMQGNCSCNTGFYGPNCAIKAKSHDSNGQYCPNGCSGNGDCTHNAKCACFKGYEGHDCGRFAHSEVPIENVANATSPYSQPDADGESMVNTGDENDPNLNNYGTTSMSKVKLVNGKFPGLEGPFPTPAQLRKYHETQAAMVTQAAEIPASKAAEIPSPKVAATPSVAKAEEVEY